MKKKIKDLALEEMEKTCSKHHCLTCPLDFPNGEHCVLIYKQSLQEYEKFNKERWIEIDENNNE